MAHVNQHVQVEIVYVSNTCQWHSTLAVPPGSTVAQLLERCELFSKFPELREMSPAVGIFSQRVGLEHVLKAGDRVEIYRPLLCDPKQARKNRGALTRSLTTLSRKRERGGQ